MRTNNNNNFNNNKTTMIITHKQSNKGMKSLQHWKHNAIKWNKTQKKKGKLNREEILYFLEEKAPFRFKYRKVFTF